MTVKASMERRAAPTEIALREADGQAPHIVGHAAVFNEMSEDLFGFRERIAPGAFTKALGNDVRALVNHDPNRVLGRTKSRTLTLQEDQKGLLVDILPPDTEEVRSLLISMRRGDVSGMSFAFATRRDNWEMIDGQVVRTLIDVDLIDVSVVTFPAYPQAEAALRSLDEFRKSLAPAPVLPDMRTLRMRLQLASL